jgi:hypothetical protein
MWTKAIWDQIPWDQIAAGQREGWVFFDDFINMPTLDEADAADTLYASYGDAGADIRQGAASEYGEVILSTDGGDNEEAWIQTGGNVGGLAKFILQATGVPHTIAFEVRWKKSSITIGTTYVGFGEEGLAAADTISDGNAIADKDLIGFYVPGADPDSTDFIYNKASGANPTTMIDNMHVIVADTYVKTGFVYHYKNAAARQIKIYKNGVINSTYVTKALIDNTTNFPGGEEMALLAGCKETSAAAQSLTLDWWRAALVVNA